MKCHGVLSAQKGYSRPLAYCALLWLGYFLFPLILIIAAIQPSNCQLPRKQIVEVSPMVWNICYYKAFLISDFWPHQCWTVNDWKQKVKSMTVWLVNDFWWPPNWPWLWLVPEVMKYLVSSSHMGKVNWFQCDLSHCHVTPNFSGPEGGSIDRMRLAAVKVKSRFDRVMTDAWLVMTKFD